MNLSPMRFKDYIWPHNPRVYEIGFRRKVVSHHVPFGRSVLEGMGMDYRILRGEGEFSGPGAYREFQKLATVFYEESPGILVHPVWQTSKAWFVELSVKQEPLEDYVAYTFEFWECYEEYTNGLREMESKQSNAETVVSQTQAVESGKAYYTVCKGDTLYAISKMYALSLPELVAMNPQIRNINLIYPGDLIRVQ